MYKIFIYKNSKFEPRFTHVNFENLEKLQEYLQHWYQVKRNDIATEFIICDKDKIIKTLNISHFE